MDILSLSIAVIVGITTGVLASVIAAASQNARDRRARREEAAKLLWSYLRGLQDRLQAAEFYNESQYWIQGTTTEAEIESARRAAFPYKEHLPTVEARESMSWILYIDGPEEAPEVYRRLIAILQPAISKAFPRSFYR